MPLFATASFSRVPADGDGKFAGTRQIFSAGDESVAAVMLPLKYTKGSSHGVSMHPQLHRSFAKVSMVFRQYLVDVCGLEAMHRFQIGHSAGFHQHDDSA